MAYNGISPASYTSNLTNVQLIDDISGSFNGSTTTFALTSNSAPFNAVSARSLFVVLGGIVQKPLVDYTTNGSNITFTIAPVSGLTFAARNIYGLNFLNKPNDGSVVPVSLSTGGPTWTSSGNLTVSGDLNVVGSFNSGTQGLFWQDNEPANFGNSNDLKIYHNGTDNYFDSITTGQKLFFRTSSSTSLDTNALTILADGKVGIGTASPEERLHVQGVGIITSSLYVGGTSSSSNSLIISNLGQDIIRPNGRILLRGGGGQSTRNSIELTNSAGIVIDGGSGETYGVEIKGGGGPIKITQGNVGIGTTNPSEKLTVAGNININTGYLKMTGVATPNHENYIQMTGNGTSYIGVGAEANPTIKFKVGSTSTTILDVSSTEVSPGTDNTYNLGSSTKRWANIYSADLQLSNEGSQNDVDGTWGQYTIQEGENDLFLLNRRNGKKYKFVLQEVN